MTPNPTAVGKYIDLYRELCGTTPTLNNQECEVITRLAEWVAQHAEAKRRGPRTNEYESREKIEREEP